MPTHKPWLTIDSKSGKTNPFIHSLLRHGLKRIGPFKRKRKGRYTAQKQIDRCRDPEMHPEETLGSLCEPCSLICRRYFLLLAILFAATELAFAVNLIQSVFLLPGKAPPIGV